MKHKYHIISLIIFLITLNGQYMLYSQTPLYTILISTSLGDMKAVLYAETPIHSENFIDLVKKGFYNGQSFHRVINNFMIQAGDPRTRNTNDPDSKNISDVDYTLPAEFNPALYHKKAVIAAARMDDSVNPQRASSGSQFYIVQGRTFSDQELDLMVKKQVHIKFTEEQRRIYKSIGGTPHLDYAYTVFGEVISGIDIIDKIAAVPVDKNNRPLKDIRLNIKILE
jgi:peptidyl-prolyl cis-trans isomerase B (cyclophilin B)